MRKPPLTALLPALFLAAAAPVAAGQVESLAVNYNIDLGPLTVTEVTYRLEVAKGAARAEARIETKGISRVFSEYTAKVNAESRADASEIAPVQFRLVRLRDGKTREAHVDWRGQGEIDYGPKDKKPERRERLEKALNADVIDPMTAVLSIGSAGKAPCPSVQQIFDGRDVFELSLTDKGTGRLDAEGYQGPVRRCEVNWLPIAGRAVERNEPRESYDVDFAPVGEMPSGKTLWIPVSLSGKLKGLRFTGYVTKLKAQQGGAAALSQE